MRMESYNLTGHAVRITWNTLASKTPHNEQTIFRGEVAHKDDTGLWLFGRFFTEKAETLSVREIPRDKNPENQLFFAPWTSIEAIQIIEEDSREFEIHQLVLSRQLESGGKPSRAKGG
ncbi:MAG TPA: hypothetical protein VMV05_10645 [bacterium]|nr:hypothetical protein [bacterium]